MGGIDLRWGIFSPIVMLATLLLSGSVAAQREASADAFGELGKLAKTYNIQIVTADDRFPVKTSYGAIDGKTADDQELQNYIRVYAQEFALYPSNLVRRSRLKCVVLCSTLSFAGQRRNAVPDFEHDTLYLDVSRGTYSEPYLRKVIHHEFFHIVDYRDDGSVYQDGRWSSLNPPGFRYGSGGQNAQDMAETSVLTDKFPGFLNHYSTTGVEEDKAEAFANLIVDLEYVEARAKKDPVINAKVERMKELLAKFCPEMDDQFWQKVRNRKLAPPNE